MLTDQRTMDGLLWGRHTADLRRAEEFGYGSRSRAVWRAQFQRGSDVTENSPSDRCPTCGGDSTGVANTRPGWRLLTCAANHQWWVSSGPRKVGRGAGPVGSRRVQPR